MKYTRACGRMCGDVRVAQQRVVVRFQLPFCRHPLTDGRQEAQARARAEALRKESAHTQGRAGKLLRAFTSQTAEQQPDSLYACKGRRALSFAARQEAQARALAEDLREELARAQGRAGELSRALAAQTAERRGAERKVKDAEVRLSAALAAKQRSDARYEAHVKVGALACADSLLCAPHGHVRLCVAAPASKIGCAA